MNRIIIIGNGFDVAHGLKTRYSDFLEDLKDEIIAPKRRIELNLKPACSAERFSETKNEDFIHRIDKDGKMDRWICVAKPKSNYYGIQDFRSNSKLNINLSNKSVYFKSLFEEKEKLGEWSDLESYYFRLLVEHKSSIEDIKLINDEFSHLKELLQDYLNKNDGNWNWHMITEHPIFNSIGLNTEKFEANFFVTFNYTSKNLGSYFYHLQTIFGRKLYPLDPIHIHGKLNDRNNPIIFGYGDENSEEYKELEKEENNELLKNFKTFQYLRTNEYVNVLGLLESSDEIYVQVIGHSCGLCDKTLMKTIFEHQHVKKIEVNYHSDASKYFEKLYNISRIIDDKILMRDKLVSLKDTFKI